MSHPKPGKKEKFAAAAQARAAVINEEKASQVPSWWAWMPPLLAVLVYLNTLGHGFALDDYAAILENQDTKKGLSALGEIFSTSYRHGYVMIADDLYRPLPKAIYAVLWHFWPDQAWPGHLLNVIVFALSCFFLYRAMSSWWPSFRKGALLTACLFAVHPVHTEVVANIKSLDELLPLLFGIISLDRFHRYLVSGKFSAILASMVFYFIAFLSKESAITLLPVFPLLGWFTGAGEVRKSVVSGLYLLLPAVLFLVIRYSVLHSSSMFTAAAPSVADNMLSMAKDPLLRFTSAVGMMGYYLLVLVWPVNLTFDMSYPQVQPMDFSDWRFISSAAVLTGMLVLAFAGLKTKRLWSFGLLFFFITASVSSNIFMRIGTHYGERLMYLPSLGMVILLAVVIIHFLDKASATQSVLSPKLLGVSIPLLLFWSSLTVARNPVWKDNGTLYFSGLTSAPNSVRVQYYQGLYLVKPETLETFPASARDSARDAGIAHLKRSTELYPTFADSWVQLGVVTARLKKYEEALAYYDKALECNPYEPVALNNSATVYFELKNFDEALKRFMRAVELKPDYADAYMNIGSCYGMAGQYDKAIFYLEKAVAADPGLSQAYYFLGITYQNMGNPARAQQYFADADRLKKK